MTDETAVNADAEVLPGACLPTSNECEYGRHVDCGTLGCGCGCHVIAAEEE
jgi:hypothetical protein